MLAGLHATAQTVPVGTLLPVRETPVHDPVMIRQDGVYYLFATGSGISVWSSKDLKTWKKEKPVFDQPPAWAVAAVPGFKGHIWAPDISYYNGWYFLYYSVSAFGKNTSCIGVAVNKTLDTAAAAYRWIDKGKVLQSIPGKTPWNAIDPNLVVDDKGTPFLSFGSFWDGLKLVKLKKNALQPAQDLDRLPTIASRVDHRKTRGQVPAVADNPVDAGGNAIEAPFIFRHKQWYYLFASIDYCCKGVNSTYKIVVGRSKKIIGPYRDRQGLRMDRGGGSLLLQGNQLWHGTGHNSVYTFDGRDYMVFHGYDANDKGKSKLRIEELVWQDEWPVVKEETGASH